MKFCVIDSATKICINVVELDHADQYVAATGQELATDHAGNIGDTWTGSAWTPAATDAEILAALVRKDRNNLLKSFVDSMNPVRWETLSDEEKQSVRTYRTALLNVPQQAGFPENIVWPTKPSVFL